MSMAVSSQTQSPQFVKCDAQPLQPFLPPHLGPFTGYQTIIKVAQYIGSFMVAGKGHHDRAEIVRQKLESAKEYTHSKPIVLLISLNGIKVCRDTDKHIYMAHALRRISYATCDPDNLQFAFLAREPKAEPNVQYCHAFVTATPDEAEELNNIVGEAFRVAYAQQQLALLARRLQPCQSAGQSPLVILQPSLSHVVSSSTDAPSVGAPLASNSMSDSMKDISSSRLTSSCEPANISLLNKPLPPLPTSQPSFPSMCDHTSEHPVRAGSNDAHSSREQRAHKHHKHHKHRHRHKAKDVAAQTADPSCDNRSLDSGLQTGESGSGDLRSDSSNRLPVHPLRIRQQLPPPPPPRGSSSLEWVSDSSGNSHSFISEARGCSKLETTVHPSTKQSSSPSKQATGLANDVDSVCLQSILEELTDGNVARPSSLASRPQSQHSYDIAEHRGYGASSITCPLDTDSKSPVPANSDNLAVTTSNMFASVVTTTTTTPSSTTGCSTATSGSVRSGSGSANSFPGLRRCESHPSDNRPDVRESSSLEKYPNRLRNTPTRRFSSNQDNSVLNCNSSHRQSRIPEPSSYDTLYEAEELRHVSWYQPRVPRETVLELLARQPPGSFIIRDSGTHANCYALSVRFGEGSSGCLSSGLQSPHSHSTSFSGDPISEHRTGSVYPLHNTGISHFLIQRTPNGGVRLKGLDKEWPSLSCLVLHLTVMPEMLPCPLRLPKSAANPTFCPTDIHAETQPPAFELAPSVSSGFLPIHNSAVDRSGNPVPVFEDEEYQSLSDFSAIMADLKLQAHVSKRSNVVPIG